MTAHNDVLLLKAAQRGDFTQLKILLETGCNVDATDHNGTTALMFAAQQGYTEIVRRLLEAGANINLPRRLYGLTALMLATAAGHVDVVQTLIVGGADVNAKNDDGSTALMVAAHKGHLKVIEILLDAGVQVNIKDKDDDTALSLAIQKGDSDVVKALLAAGADAEEALNLAASEGHVQTVQLLLQGVSADSPNSDGRTALMQAAELGYLSVVQEFVYVVLESLVATKKKKRNPGMDPGIVIKVTDGKNEEEIVVQHSNQGWQINHTPLDNLLVDANGEKAGTIWITAVIDT
jgi:ankyrin repeat protein